jgi:hypothetical protein
MHVIPHVIINYSIINVIIHTEIAFIATFKQNSLLEVPYPLTVYDYVFPTECMYYSSYVSQNRQ